MGYGKGKLQIIEHDGKGGLRFEERPVRHHGGRARSWTWERLTGADPPAAARSRGPLKSFRHDRGARVNPAGLVWRRRLLSSTAIDCALSPQLVAAFVLGHAGMSRHL
jgi:hypothetical protein